MSVASKIELIIDPEGMLASVRTPRGGAAAAITDADVRALLSGAGIPIDDRTDRRISRFLNHPTGDGASGDDPFDLAVGVAPVEATDGRLDAPEWERLANRPFQDRIAKSTRLVKMGDVIGMIVAPQPGQPGKDVFGAPIPPERSEGSQIVAQKGVDVDKDGIVTATTGGRLVYVAQRVSVRPFDRLDRDIVVGAELETPGRDLIVEGIVGSGVNLSSEHSVVVVGSVESARIACGVDLIIKGGAVGAGDAALTAKRDVVFKFAEESRIEAGHHVIADASLVRAEIVAGACVIAPRAVLVGGYVRARCGIIAGTVGNDVMTPTRLSVGAEIDVARRAIELEELLKNKRAELERIQRSLAPLEVNRRRLSPVQKEELTELTFDASTVADSIQKIKDERQARLRALNDGAFIHVMDSVFEGVELVIADRCCRIKRKIVGPVRFEKKRTHGATEMVATFQNAGRVLTLNSRAMI